MPVETLVTYCAPTLAGLKTGNIFNYEFTSQKHATETLTNLNQILTPKGLRIIQLAVKRKRWLLYLYRPAHLQNDFRNPNIISCIDRLGYPINSIEKCITELSQRIQKESFPHEIGLFLGYPLCDVLGFMQEKPCKCYGLWKVYENEEETLELFSKYEKCTDIYQYCIKKGMSLEQLAIAA